MRERDEIIVMVEDEDYSHPNPDVSRPRGWLAHHHGNFGMLILRWLKL